MIIPSCNVVYGTVFEEKLSPGKESDTRVRVQRNGGRLLVKNNITCIGVTLCLHIVKHNYFIMKIIYACMWHEFVMLL